MTQLVTNSKDTDPTIDHWLNESAAESRAAARRASRSTTA
jgi:hypothetical protein